VWLRHNEALSNKRLMPLRWPARGLINPKHNDWLPPMAHPWRRSWNGKTD
jgi:hypothetical protein